jgi:hypothetical protein
MRAAACRAPDWVSFNVIDTEKQDWAEAASRRATSPP